jgi:hypothetical protein
MRNTLEELGDRLYCAALAIAVCAGLAAFGSYIWRMPSFG